MAAKRKQSNKKADPKALTPVTYEDQYERTIRTDLMIDEQGNYYTTQGSALACDRNGVPEAQPYRDQAKQADPKYARPARG